MKLLIVFCMLAVSANSFAEWKVVRALYEKSASEDVEKVAEVLGSGWFDKELNQLHGLQYANYEKLTVTSITGKVRIFRWYDDEECTAPVQPADQTIANAAVSYRIGEKLSSFEYMIGFLDPCSDEVENSKAFYQLKQK